MGKIIDKNKCYYSLVLNKFKSEASKELFSKIGDVVD